MSDLVRQQNEQLRAQNNAPAWRDCNAAGLKHQWVESVILADEEGNHLTTYWRCQRKSCAVDTRTTGEERPKGMLR